MGDGPASNPATDTVGSPNANAERLAAISAGIRVPSNALGHPSGNRTPDGCSEKLKGPRRMRLLETWLASCGLEPTVA